MGVGEARNFSPPASEREAGRYRRRCESRIGVLRKELIGTPIHAFQMRFRQVPCACEEFQAAPGLPMDCGWAADAPACYRADEKQGHVHMSKTARWVTVSLTAAIAGLSLPAIAQQPSDQRPANRP